MSKYHKFYRSARERVLSTAAQVSLAIAGVEAFIASTGIGEDHWVRLTSYGVVATALSLVKVLAAKKIGDPESGSLNRVEHGMTPDEMQDYINTMVARDGGSLPCERGDCPRRNDGV